MKKIVDFLLGSVSNIPGIGPKTVELFTRIGIYSKIDLLNHHPFRIEKKLFFPQISSSIDKFKIVTSVEILKVDKPSFARSSRVKAYRVITFDGLVEIELVFFNNPYIVRNLKIGKKIIVSGVIEHAGTKKYKIIHPHIHGSINNISKYDVIYPMTKGLSSTAIQKAIQYVLTNLTPMPEWIPKHKLKIYQWEGWYDSMVSIHNSGEQSVLSPESKYIKRLAFDELLASQLAIKILRKYRSTIDSKGQIIKFSGVLAQNILSELGMQLTEGQKKAVAQIEYDQASSKRMMRLLQGDVGCGKTLVAVCAMVNTRESRLQSALMAPTEILAMQHYKTIKNMVRNRDVVVEVLTSKVSKAKRRDILLKLKEYKIHILIGTHALFQADVEFFDLGLVVIDEQHRFGVKQRIELMNKGDKCDVLVMSATPIPRTLAMSVYGDLDITTIKDKPIGRQPIKTLTISEDREEEVIRFIRERLSKNEQIYWVCPLIESKGAEVESFDAAEDRYNILKKYFGEDKVELLHGKMTTDKKEAAMDKFVQNIKPILVATTVIEVGVDVRNATLLVVEKADRFGLSQLHQLRGRVGRGDKNSYCILLFPKNMSRSSYARLKTLKESEDGFYIAEQDFKIRGGGDILGSKQSGLPNYQIASFEYHAELLFEASEFANKVVGNDNYQLEEYQALIKLFGYKNSGCYLNS